MESLVSTFHIDWKLIVAQMVNFAVVFAVLYWFALKPLSKLMSERKDEIEKGLSDAKENASLLEQAKIELEENNRKIRMIAAESQQKTTKELEKLREENLNKIKEDNALWAKERAKQIEADKHALIASVKTEIAGLVIAVVTKVVGDKMETQVNKKLVEDTINDVWK